MYKALTIAGSDSSGGAGIQADIKTMAAHGVYAMSAITALTAQNTTGVSGIFEVTPEFLAKQLDAVFTDIFPDAVKIGMLSGSAIMKIVAEKLKEYAAKNIVLDPVMVATSGSRLMKSDAAECLVQELFPIADLITPNIPEAEALTGMTITSAEEMQEVAAKLYQSIRDAKAKATATEQSAFMNKDTAVLLKGGHSICDANDILVCHGQVLTITGDRIDNPNTHGTGCTLSSAIASNLAMGKGMEESVRAAKAYISGALRDGLDLGKGSGPLNHMFQLNQ